LPAWSRPRLQRGLKHAGPVNLGGRHGLKPFPRFVQLLEGPALDAGRSLRLDVTDGELAEIGGGRFTGGKSQATFNGPRKPLVDNPESVFRRNGRQSRVVTKYLAAAVLADEREQVLMNIPELDLCRVLLPNYDDAVIGFIVDDGADRVVPEILQQLKAIAGLSTSPPYHREKSSQIEKEKESTDDLPENSR
jgi:hypothetical protein